MAKAVFDSPETRKRRQFLIKQNKIEDTSSIIGQVKEENIEKSRVSLLTSSPAGNMLVSSNGDAVSKVNLLQPADTERTPIVPPPEEIAREEGMGSYANKHVFKDSTVMYNNGSTNKVEITELTAIERRLEEECMLFAKMTSGDKSLDSIDKQDYTNINPEELLSRCTNEIRTTFPGSGETFPIGVTIETQIRTRLQKKWAVHTIAEINNASIAYELGLRTGNKLLKLCGIRTDGMTGDILVAQFLSLDIKDITLTVEQQDKTITIEAELQVDDQKFNMKSVKNECMKEKRQRPMYKRAMSISSSVCIEVDETTLRSGGIDSELDIAHPVVIDIEDMLEVAHSGKTENCRIEHPVSEHFVRVQDGRLVATPLQKNDRTALFKRDMFGVYDEVKSAMTVFLFREKLPHSTRYISAVGLHKIGIQEYKHVLDGHPDILNADDPRLFQHQFSGTHDMFRTTCLRDNYLAVTNEKLVTLKNVLEDELNIDEDIHFKVRYCPNS